MTKTRALLGIVTLVGLGWASSGCSNSCDEADDLCSGCDATWHSGCQQSVDTCRALPSGPGFSEGDCCDSVIDQYKNHC